MLRGFPTPSGKLEFYSSTLAAWGWQEYAVPTYIKSHVHPENMAPDQKFEMKIDNDHQCEEIEVWFE